MKNPDRNLFTDFYPLADFNQLYRQMDEIYHAYAKKLGISDATLWLLYSLYESDSAYTQRDLCSAWHYPPQTINSILKNLEKQGIIKLESVSGNKKNKLIVLTEEGENLSQKAILPLVLAEQNSFQKMTQGERERLLSLTQKYVRLLQNEVG